MKFISQLAVSARAWLLLAISTLGLELAALYFQYAMDLAPCIMCIYQRVAIWAIFFAGIAGYFSSSLIIGRIVAFGLWAVGAIWGLIIALEHVEMQSANKGPLSFLFSCDIVPNFPSWAPLHEWIPALFEASGDCGEISWQFLGHSMPEWMVVVYSVYTALFAAVLVARLVATKKP